jgi:oxygen-independent coproporphyrinogen-3 oxidase
MEFLIMGLRTSTGLDLGRLERLTGLAVPPATLDDLQEIGLAVAENGVLRTTRQGRLLLNSIIAKLADHIGNAG